MIFLDCLFGTARDIFHKNLPMSTPRRTPQGFQRWDQNGEDAATIVIEYRAGRCRRGRFLDFIAGREEWLRRYSESTLKKQYRNTIDRYERWLRGGKPQLSRSFTIPSLLTREQTKNIHRSFLIAVNFHCHCATKRDLTTLK